MVKPMFLMRPGLNGRQCRKPVNIPFEVASDANFSTSHLQHSNNPPVTYIPSALAAPIGGVSLLRMVAVKARNPTTSFTVRTLQRWRLVDDDGSGGWADVGLLYEDVLANSAFPVIGIQADNGTFEPSRLDDVPDYSTIIWFNGFIGGSRTRNRASSCPISRRRQMLLYQRPGLLLQPWLNTLYARLPWRRGSHRRS